MEAKAEYHETPESPPRHLRVVTSAEETEQIVSSCEAHDGAGATVTVDGQGQERLSVRDREGTLLFEYHPGVARCVVYAPTKDLVLRAAGCIELDAAEGLKLHGGRSVELETESWRVRAASTEAELEQVRVTGETLTSTFRRVRQTVDLIETQAGRVVERARETYREVEGLAQIRADRIRQVAERTFQVLGTHTLLKARQDLKLRGEKIHLG